MSEVAGSGGDKLEGPDTAKNDSVHLKRRLGLFSGVALIVGTMIGNVLRRQAARSSEVPPPSFLLQVLEFSFRHPDS